MSTVDQNWMHEISFPSCMNRAHELIDVILEEIRQMHWSDRELFAIQLSLEEAFINAVTHGNKSDGGKKVRFFYTLSPDSVRFRVDDEGEGFNYAELPDPTDPEHIDTASGRGVLLIRSFMTHAQFNPKGNSLIMEKVRQREER